MMYTPTYIYIYVIIYTCMYIYIYMHDTAHRYLPNPALYSYTLSMKGDTDTARICGNPHLSCLKGGMSCIMCQTSYRIASCTLRGVK